MWEMIRDDETNIFRRTTLRLDIENDKVTVIYLFKVENQPT